MKQVWTRISQMITNCKWNRYEQEYLKQSLTVIQRGMIKESRKFCRPDKLPYSSSNPRDYRQWDTYICWSYIITIKDSSFPAINNHCISKIIKLYSKACYLVSANTVKTTSNLWVENKICFHVMIMQEPTKEVNIYFTLLMQQRTS